MTPLPPTGLGAVPPPGRGTGAPAPGGRADTLGVAPEEAPAEDEGDLDLVLLEVLAQDAHATVYRGRGHGREVAVRLYARRASGAADPALAALRREASLLAILDHPNVARAVAVGTRDGRPFLATELIRGERLDVLLQRGPLPPGETVRTAVDLADALEAAHRVGLLHGDLAPRHVMRADDGRYVLVGFASHLRSAGGPTAAVPRHDLHYVAPEQTGLVERHVDERADLYALGALLFHCSSGRPPFEDPDPLVLARLHATASPPDLRDLAPDTPEALATAVTRLLEKDPDDRFPSAAALADALADLPGADRGQGNPGARTARAKSPRAPAVLGRERELAALDEHLEAVRRGSARVVTVRGERGCGRTAFLRAFAERARSTGALVVFVQGPATAMGPRHALLAALETFLREDPDPRRPRLSAVAPLLRRVPSYFSELSRALLDDPPTTDSRGALAFAEDDRVHVAVSVLAELGTVVPPLVVLVDDAERLHPLLARILTGVVERTSPVSALVVLACREDSGADPVGREPTVDALLSLARHELRLGPLAPSAVADLLAGRLGGHELIGPFVAELVRRAAGSPTLALALLERALDAGALRPEWGRFVVDETVLTTLELPGDVVDVLDQRVGELDELTRELVELAAVAGPAARVATLRRALSAPSDVGRALEAARRVGVLDEADGVAEFLHEDLRRRLRDRIDPERRRMLHRRLADAISPPGEPLPDGADLLALARHLVAGTPDDPARILEACARAGRAALAAGASHEAVDLLDAGRRIAAESGHAVGADLLADLGAALLSAGRLPEASERLGEALAAETDPLRRALLHAGRARAALGSWRAGEVLDELDAGLAELGRRLPRSRLAKALGFATRVLVALPLFLLRVGAGRAREAERARLEAEVALYDLAGQAAYLEARWSLALQLAARALHPVNRLGSGRQYVVLTSSVAMLLTMAGARRAGARMLRRARRAAEEAGDPALVGHVAVREALALDFSGSTARAVEHLLRALTSHAGALDLADYLPAASALVIELGLLGRTAEQEEWCARVIERIRYLPARDVDAAGAVLVGIVSAAMRGDRRLALERLEAARVALGPLARLRSGAAGLANARIHLHLLLGELGEPLEEAVHDFLAVARMRPRRAPLHYRVFWVALAEARLRQAAAATGAERATRLEAARHALRDLRAAANTPLLRVAEKLARARYEVLVGRPRRALRLLDRLAGDVTATKSPLAEFQRLVTKCRALRAVGDDALAADGLAQALVLARRHGWVALAAQVREEFGLPADPGWGAGGPEEHVGGGDAGAGGDPSPDELAPRRRRELEVLVRVARAAASLPEPEDLAALALDAALEVTAADRAAFLRPPAPLGAPGETGAGGIGFEVRVERRRSRAPDDQPSREPPAAAVVERALQTHAAILVPGAAPVELPPTLRSALALPVETGTTVVGVLYLDSRLARGVFGLEDAEVLAALSAQVATAFEAARVAALERSVASERRRRVLAEAVRDTMAALAAHHDADEIARVMLERALLLTDASTGALVLHEEAVPGVGASPRAARVALVAGRVAPGRSGGGADEGRPETAAVTARVPPEDVRLDLERETLLADVLAGSGPLTGPSAGEPPPLRQLLGEPRSFAVVPVRGQERATGVLVLGSEAPDGLGEAEVALAAAVASQGGLALEGARLLREVSRLAEVDDLTGLPNRRRLLTLGEQELAVAARYGRPLSVCLLDIDHFKEVNDTLGHAAGDEVLREVARRLASELRTPDLLGRYGGEEFLALLPETPDARELAERLRAAVAARPVVSRAGTISVTVSAGVAARLPGDASLPTLVERADAALYEAKRAGRNRVASASSGQSRSSAQSGTPA